MLFNTYTFGLFLLIVFWLYEALPLRGRQWMLLVASYIFYCWEKPVYGILLLISTVQDYICARLMGRFENPRHRRWVLVVSLVGGLGMLGFFKYADFFGANLAGLGSLLGFNAHWKPMGIILPVGISFYTFQTLSYTIDVYRRRLEPCRDFVSFALFVSFFPQLVAGPIERATHLLPQLRVYHRVALYDLAYGGMRIILGLFRKVVLADRFSIMADRVFAHPSDYPTFTVWVGVFAFVGQMYCDFAGYADIAIGSARLFGVDIMENFRQPLAATSIADFWNRWHISLTSWLRDYLFNPLGGARRGGVRTALNGTVVLMLCGLWHGASWTFVAWGTYHAILMTLYYTIRYWRKGRGGTRAETRGHGWWLVASALFVLTLNAFGIVFFRSANLPAAGRVFAAMFGLGETCGLPNEWYAYVYALLFLPVLLVDFGLAYGGLAGKVARLPWWVRALGLSAMVVVMLLTATNLTIPYIYFQF